MAPYAVAYGLPGGPIQGPTAFKPLFRTFRDALSDLSIDVVRTLSMYQQIGWVANPPLPVPVAPVRPLPSGV
jgi:hypothetical protein